MTDIWYPSGSIPEAIRLSKLQSKLFLVYITGKDDASRRMNELWKNEKIISLCNRTCVSIKLKVDSEGCRQFSAIYPVLETPSAHFIDNVGKLVQTLTSESSIDELVVKVEEVTESYASEDKTRRNDTVQTDVENSSVDENAPQKQTKRVTAASADTGKGDESIDSTHSESSSRKASKHTKPNEKSLATQKVSTQLDQYRDALSKEFDKEAEDRKKKIEEEKLIALEAQRKEDEQKRVIRLSQCRVQFRLPDGSSLAHTFSATDVLASALSYLKREMAVLPQNQSFLLRQIYPKRDFTVDDNDKTFKDLEMVPSASLIVVPVTNTKASGIIDFLWSIIMFIIMLPQKLISKLVTLFAAPTPQNNVNQSQSYNPRNPSGVENRNLRKRRTGGMAHLSADDDDDDDNATWNGNSTQQM